MDRGRSTVGEASNLLSHLKLAAVFHAGRGAGQQPVPGKLTLESCVSA
jgi:hypothetical protein